MPHLSAAMLEELDEMATWGRKMSDRGLGGSDSTGQGDTTAGSVLAPTTISLPALHQLDKDATDDELWWRRVSLLSPSQTVGSLPMWGDDDVAGMARTVASLPAMRLQETEDELLAPKVSLLTPPQTHESLPMYDEDAESDGPPTLTVARLPAMHMQETDEELWARRVSLLTPHETHESLPMYGDDDDESDCIPVMTVASLPAMHLQETDEELWARRVSLLNPSQTRDILPIYADEGDDITVLTVASLPAVCFEETDEELWERRVSLLGLSLPAAVEACGQGWTTKTVASMPALHGAGPVDAGLWRRRTSPMAPAAAPPKSQPWPPRPTGATHRKAATDVNCAVARHGCSRGSLGLPRDDGSAKLRRKLRELKLWRAIAEELGASEGLPAPDDDVASALLLMESEGPGPADDVAC